MLRLPLYFAQVIAFIVCYVYMVKDMELLRLSRSDLFDSHLLRRSMKLCGENCGYRKAQKVKAARII